MWYAGGMPRKLPPLRGRPPKIATPVPPAKPVPSTLVPGALTLTEQEEKFVKAYIETADATKAAQRAGYNQFDRPAVMVLVTKPAIVQRLEEYRLKTWEDGAVTFERVVRGLLREAEREGVGAAHSARVAAWMALAKLMGFERPQRHVVEVQPSLPADLTGMTPVQLEQAYREAVAIDVKATSVPQEGG